MFEYWSGKQQTKHLQLSQITTLSLTQLSLHFEDFKCTSTLYAFIIEGLFDERCVYKEHLYAKNRENIFTGVSSVTKYLRIVRAFYVIARAVTSEVHVTQSSPQPRLTTRTFVPAQIGVIATSLPINMCNISPYEETRRVLERINHWLSITG